MHTSVDTKKITPNRLEGDINYTVYEQFDEVTYRGSHCDIKRLISYLEIGLSNKACKKGDKPSPSELTEVEAAKEIIKWIEDRHPVWFGARNEDALVEHARTVSDSHLDTRRIARKYFKQESVPESSKHLKETPTDNSPIKDTWEDHVQIIIPIVAITLSQLQKQMNQD